MRLWGASIGRASGRGLVYGTYLHTTGGVSVKRGDFIAVQCHYVDRSPPTPAGQVVAEVLSVNARTVSVQVVDGTYGPVPGRRPARVPFRDVVGLVVPWPEGKSGTRSVA